LKYRISKPGMLLFLVCLLSAYTAHGQTVTGTITDEAGDLLPGVAVVIRGTTAGVITDLDGNYTIDVDDPQGTILEYSYVGMERQEISVNGRTRIDVVMR